MKVTFDGQNKIISINPGVNSINVKIDLYSEWKRWLLQGDNLKYAQAFRTFGGDPTNADGTQVAPQYFFLMNGWRIAVDGQHVSFASNLYTDEGDSPYVVTNGGSVNAQTSDSPVVVTEGTGATNVWEQLLNEHHDPGSFGEILQKIYLDASKAAGSRFE